MATVNEKMTAIAEPIRTFMKESDKLSLDDMAEKANQVVTANENLEKVLYGTDFGGKSYYDEFWNNFQHEGKRVTYAYAFSGSGWNEKTFNPKYPIDIGTGEAYRVQGMFYRFNCAASESMDFRLFEDVLNAETFKNARSANALFNGAVLNYIDVNLENCTTLLQTFTCDMNQTYCTDLKLKVSEKCTSYGGTFAYCNKLTNLEFKEGSVIAADISFSYSSLLTPESLASIINALKDLTGTGLTRILTLHADSKELLNSTSEGRALIAMATEQKGWTIA